VKLPTIYIPTLGRSEHQLTYSILPQNLQDKVIFVIRPAEKEVFKHNFPKNKLAICPEWVNNIGTTREFIKQIAGKTYHWVMDDDITKVRSRSHDPSREPRWQSQLVDWTELLYAVEKELSTAHCIGFAAGGTFPMHERMPYKENIGGFQWFCFSGEEDVKWDRVELCEDIDALLQMLTSGKRVIRFEKYLFYRGKDGQAGGCSTFRNKTRHNKAHKKMQELWPGLVKATLQTASRKGPSGYALSTGRDNTWLFLRVQWSKAAKQGKV